MHKTTWVITNFRSYKYYKQKNTIEESNRELNCDKKKVKEALLRYEEMERLSLLELAVTKSSVCDGVYFTNLEQMKEYSVLEEGFDRSKYLKRARITSGAEVIIPLVRRYL